MDPISKALERAESERSSSVRNWVRPSSAPVSGAPGAGAAAAEPAPEMRQSQHARPDIPAVRDPVEPAGIETVALDKQLLQRNHIICGLEGDDPVVVDRYRVLRTRVLQLMQPNGWKVLGITSPGAKAGKTLTSINLSMSLARDPAFEVILVDADLRKSSLATDLGLPDRQGVVDYLNSDSLTLDNLLLQSQDMPNLKFLSGHRKGEASNSSDVFNSPRMAQLVSSLRNHSDNGIVVVDLPPIFVGDDVIGLAPSLDCFLLLVDETTTQVNELSEAAQMLAGHNLLGTVLNKSEQRSRAFEGYYQPSSSVDDSQD